MTRKDYWHPAVIGLITAFFASIILLYSNTPIAYKGINLPIGLLFIILPVGEALAYVIAARLFNKIQALKQLGKFGIVGVMNFSVDTGIVYFLQHITGFTIEDNRFIWLFVISSCIAIINSYFWQRSWTFNEQAPPTRKEFIGFVFVTIVGIGINSSIAIVAARALSSASLIAPSRIVAVSKLAATIISLVWNFLGYKFFVFKA